MSVAMLPVEEAEHTFRLVPAAAVPSEVVEDVTLAMGAAADLLGLRGDVVVRWFREVEPHAASFGLSDDVNGFVMGGYVWLAAGRTPAATASTAAHEVAHLYQQLVGADPCADASETQARDFARAVIRRLT